MGKRRTIHGSERIVSQRPTNSVFQLGCFMRMTREPSGRTILFASQSKRARQAPANMSTMKAMYVPSVTLALVLTLMFCPRGIYHWLILYPCLWQGSGSVGCYLLSTYQTTNASTDVK